MYRVIKPTQTSVLILLTYILSCQNKTKKFFLFKAIKHTSVYKEPADANSVTFTQKLKWIKKI